MIKISGRRYDYTRTLKYMKFPYVKESIKGNPIFSHLRKLQEKYKSYTNLNDKITKDSDNN
jgi:hypothetical protein